MKKLLIPALTLLSVLFSCKKNDTTPPENSESILSDSTIIVTNDVIGSSLITVDSTKLTFTGSGTGVDKVKVGSILVSDISSVAPIGFLRRVTGVSTIGANKVFTTEQASLTDAIVKGKVNYSRLFTDSDIISEDSSGIDISAQQRIESISLTFNYSKVLYDRDGNYSTTYDQIKVIGEMKIEPTLNFELEIDSRRVTKFIVKLNLKNTNKISAEVKALLPAFNTEVVLKTIQLKPFTILVAGVPVPIAKQWIAIVLGIDGSITAKVTGGAENVNTAVAGISYENNSWSTINTIENSFTFPPPAFEGALKIEPWLQARYEIRPYGVKDSRIFVGVKGSLIAEAVATPSGITSTLKWGVKFNAKAQMQIWNRSVLNFEQIFFEREFPIYQASSFAYPTLSTTNPASITQTSLQSGGTISSDGGATVTARGVCWSISPNPTIANNTTSNGTGTGSFTSSVSGLMANTTYYLRAYATNSAGTGYGNEISIVTQPVSVTLPTLTTNSIFNVTPTSAQGGGNVISDGGASVTARGICWSTSPNPTISNSFTVNGVGLGNFVSSMSSLSPNTSYYVRAYATNSSGTAYGNQAVFSTATGTVTDIDGNVYTTVTIGTQIWMVQNLRVTRYRNGDAIPNVTDAGQWFGLSQSGAYCNYDNDANNVAIYGRLYNWWAANDSRNIAPTGWHVPTEAEWTILENYLGGANIAGGKMKEAGTLHWLSPNTGATNISGFTGLPGGTRGSTGNFSAITTNGIWWTSTIWPSFGIYYHSLRYAAEDSYSWYTAERSGLSIRCIKD